MTATQLNDPPQGSDQGPENQRESNELFIPAPWTLTLVCAVFLIAAVLVGIGKPVNVVLEALAGASYVGTEAVRRLHHE